ncbi:unnamed protein product [Lymnaea stagnalis]|uniref:Uncharacterized protein n=1 Tax=Lymnaea stagnalis TaxID=6523 RepID=A0AAV2HYD1_LYMST
MFKLVIALSLAAIFCECSPIRKDLLSRRRRACRELLASSLALSLVLPGDSSAVAELADDAVYARYCQQFQPFKRLFNDIKSKCDDDDLLEALEKKTAEGDIICTLEGKEAILAYNSAECVTNDVKSQEVENLQNACFEDYALEIAVALNATLQNGKRQEPIDFPNYEEQLSNCVITRTTEKCGEEFGRILRLFSRIEA